MKAQNKEFLDRTLAVWQPRTSRPLTPEDARQIAENMVGFFATLMEWAEAERRAAVQQQARAEATENN